MRNEQIKIIELTGKPYEIGVLHGSKAKAEIMNSINTYRDMFMTYAKMTWEEAKLRSAKYIPIIDAFDPDLMDEIRGVAVGAELETEDILALNARSEVILTQSEKPKKEMTNGCTAFSVSGDGALDGHILLGQNCDLQA